MSRLVVTDFRSYVRAEIALDGRPVVLTGENGAGKTNLLEAISLLSPGRGLRGASYAEIARQGGAGGWAVAATVETQDGPVRIGTGIEPGSEATRSRT
ncbi:MAG: AAA family ATPase, partial [Parvibaculum sp.]